MPSRTYQAPSTEGYRFVFNGQERDDEVAGEGNSYTAEFWQYDSRLGRRFNIDPVEKRHESPYACFSNNPILLIDINGADTTLSNNKSGNLIVWIQDSDKVNYDKMKQQNWDLIVVRDIADASSRLENYSNNNGVDINNLVFRTHGTNGEILAGGDDFSANTFGIYEVRDYRINGKNATELDKVEAKALMAIIDMSSMIKDGGNFVITSCKAGRNRNDGDFGLELSKLLISDLNMNINLYMNQDRSSYYKSGPNSSDQKVYTKFDIGLTSKSGYNYGWTLFKTNSTGTVQRNNLGGNIGLSLDGTQPIFYKKFVEEKPWWSF